MGSFEPENRAQLESRGVCQRILEVMSMYINDPRVIQEGCMCVRGLAQEVDCPAAISVLVTCVQHGLQHFPKKHDLIWTALAALHALPLPAAPDERRILIANLACAAARRHPRANMVTAWVTKLLAKLIQDDLDVQNLLMSDESNKVSNESNKVSVGANKVVL